MHRMPLRLEALLLAALLAAGSAASAQLASLVADLNPLRGSDAGVFPGQFATVGGKAVFVAFELDPPGQHLWASDGTAAGSERLSELRFAQHVGPLGGRHLWLALGPFGASAVLLATDGTRGGTVELTPPEVHPDAQSLTRVGSTLYFLAYPPTGGALAASLWRTDGTPAGTREVAAFPGRLVASRAAALGGRLYFFTAEPRDEGTRPFALWRSDGTAAGTVQVTVVGSFELYESPTDLFGATPRRLVFAAPGRRGFELWASDGTAAGTRPITQFADPHPFPPGAPLQVLRGRAFFPAYVEGGSTLELWASDGTGAGTRALTDFAGTAPLGVSFDVSQMVAVGSGLLFPAVTEEHGRELWRTDGSPGGTRLLADLCPGACWGFPGYGTVDLDGRLVFVGYDDAYGAEPWVTDGSSGGTALVEDICPGPCSSSSFVLAAGGVGMFHGLDPEHGYELWQTDGTAAGTRRLTDFALEDPFGPGVGIAEAGRAGDRLLFAAEDGRRGVELWRAGEAPGRERLVTDIARGRGPAADPIGLVARGNEVFFFACTETSVALWRSDGTAPGTAKALDLPGHSCVNFYNGFYEPDPPPLAVSGGLVFMNLARLWRSDGTPEGTLPLSPFEPQTGFPVVFSAMVPFRDGVAFAMLTDFGAAGAYEMELWASDGTPAGTSPLGLHPDPIDLRELTAVGDRLYYFADDGEHGWEAWTSDGTAVGTRRLTDRADRQLAASGRPSFARAGEATYFAVTEVGSSSDLWQTDGTPEGTRRLDGLFGEHQARGARDLTALGGSLVFVGTVNAEGVLALWATDGTAAGTALLAAFDDGSPFGTAVSRPAALGSRLFLLVESLDAGMRLWATDGTPGGTSVVAQGLPRSFLGPNLVSAGGRLYFVAYDDAHGIELWESDGTPAGTRLAHDVAPGPEHGLASTLPPELVAAGPRLFFAADDGLFGRELWSVAPTADPACVPGATALCLAGGRFRAQAVFRDASAQPAAGLAAAASEESGAFSFSRPESPDLFLKLVDGTAVNGHGWVFLGSLSSLDFSLTLADTATGASRRYHNLAGAFASFADLEAFAEGGALRAGLVSLPEASPARPALAPKARGEISGLAGHPEACSPGPTRLCLLGGRFEASVAWEVPGGQVTAAQAAPWSDGAGTFAFLRPSRVEVALKMIDGRPINGRFWLFSTSLTGLAYTVRVTDTTSGTGRTYASPAGSFTAFGDLRAF